MTITEDICVFSKAKLGNSVFNIIFSVKPLSNRRPPKNGKGRTELSTYGVHNNLNAKDYDNTRSYPTDLIAFGARNAECNQLHRIHANQKPLSLIGYLIKTYSNEGDLVLDNCSGSATTAEACEITGRNYICIEKEKDIYDVGVERIKNYFEKQKQAC